MDAGGIGIVGRLTAIDMVVGRAIGILASLVTHDLEGTVGDHLIGIHIGRSAGTTLDHIDREILKMLTLHDLTASLSDSIILLASE